jgi:RNA polymerase sigma-70 factor (ECF subfamily)
MQDFNHRDELERIYSALFDRLYRYAVYRIPETHDAEDIVSDTFILALQHLHQFDATKGTLEQWVFGIARRKIVDYWRSRKILLAFDDVITMIETTSRSMTDRLSDKLFVERIMKGLPAHVHAMFALHYIDGLTYEEIAEITQRTPEAVRQFFSRTHRKLRQQFSTIQFN